MAKPTQWYVYALKDPASGEVRYVGWTSNPSKRLRTHVNSGWRRRPKTHRTCWIRSLLVRGLKPLMEVLESGYGDPCPAEIAWIAKMRQDGARLTNSTDGGDGAVGYRFSEEGRRKLSDSHRGYVMPFEQREAIRAAHKKRPMTPERLHALQEFAARMRDRLTADSHARAAASKRGRKQSPEWIEKRRRANIGKVMSQLARERMREAARARCSTPEGMEQARMAARRARKALFDAGHKDQLWLI